MLMSFTDGFNQLAATKSYDSPYNVERSVSVVCNEIIKFDR